MDIRAFCLAKSSHVLCHVFPHVLIIMLLSLSIYLLVNYVNLLPAVKLVFHSLDKPNLAVTYLSHIEYFAEFDLLIVWNKNCFMIFL